MKNYLLIPNLFIVYLLVAVIAVFAQETTPKKPAVKIWYALSGTLTVYERPDTSSPVIGQLIYNETIHVVVGSELVERGSDWVQIVSPYEGFFQQSKPTKESGLATIDRSARKQRFGRKQEADQDESKAEPAGNAETDQRKQQVEAMSDNDQAESDQEQSSVSARDLFDQGNTILLGLGVSLYTIPEESGYSVSGSPFEIYFEWVDPESLLSNIRFGLNSAREKDSDYTINTLSLYAAYRLTFDQFSSNTSTFYGMVGPAAMFSSISGNASKSASSIGFMVGLGGTYRLFWEFYVGSQLSYFTNQQDFDVVKRYVGSTQLLLTMDYRF